MKTTLTLLLVTAIALALIYATFDGVVAYVATVIVLAACVGYGLRVDGAK